MTVQNDKLNLDALWQKYAVSRDTETKNQILPFYFPLVKSIARRLMPKYSGFSDADDLLSCGMVGLIDAVEKFDTKFGVKFETYATTRIRGEILDYMRQQDWAPSSLRKKITVINRAYEDLEGKYGRHPTDEEVAASIGMNADDVLDILATTQMFSVMHFEDLVSETFTINDVAAPASENPEAIAERKELKSILADIIEALPEKERLIITLYYYEELTLKQIAGILDISESRVSQIHSKVISRIGYKLNKTI